MAEGKGWYSLAKRIGPSQLWGAFVGRPRRYQVKVVWQGVEFIQFAPSGESKQYFRNYVGRINAAGFYPLIAEIDPSYRLEFPTRTQMRGAYLAGADLKGLSFSMSDMMSCNLQGAQLIEAQLAETRLSHANLKDADLFSAHLYRTELTGSDVTGASFWMSDLRGTKVKRIRGLTQSQLDVTAAGSADSMPEGLLPPQQWEIYKPGNHPLDGPMQGGKVTSEPNS
jgi:hypothetical protein